MTGMIGGFKDRKIENRTKVEPVTTQYIGKNRQGLDVVGQVYYSLVTNGAVLPGCTTSVLTTTSTSSYKVGDLLKFTSGALDTEFAFIQALTSTTITLSQTLSEVPATLATYNIYRPGIPVINSDGAVQIYTDPTVPIAIDLRKVNAQSITNFISVDGFATGETILNTGVYSAGIPGWVPWDGAVTVASLPLPSGAATEATLSTLNGKVTACNTGAVVISSALPAGTNNIGDVDVLTLPGVAGTVASDAADSGNPVKVGYRARTANITAVAQDDRVDGIADPLGRKLVQNSLSGTRFRGRNASLITNTTSTSLIAAAGSGISYVITAITVMNSHASTSTEVYILDGSTVVWSGPAGAGMGGYSISFPDGLVCTANTAINAQCGTTGASIRACVAGHTII